MNKFKITRFILFPIIIIADFLQNNFTNYFTPMNLGPVTTKSWSKMINNFFKKKDFVLDYGCGVGFFCRLFNHKKYLGIDINKNFIISAKKKTESINLQISIVRTLKNTILIQF